MHRCHRCKEMTCIHYYFNRNSHYNSLLYYYFSILQEEFMKEYMFHYCIIYISNLKNISKKIHCKSSHLVNYYTHSGIFNFSTILRSNLNLQCKGLHHNNWQLILEDNCKHNNKEVHIIHLHTLSTCKPLMHNQKENYIDFDSKDYLFQKNYIQMDFLKFRYTFQNCMHLKHNQNYNHKTAHYNSFHLNFYYIQ